MKISSQIEKTTVNDDFKTASMKPQDAYVKFERVENPTCIHILLGFQVEGFGKTDVAVKEGDYVVVPIKENGEPILRDGKMQVSTLSPQDFQLKYDQYCELPDGLYGRERPVVNHIGEMLIGMATSRKWIFFQQCRDLENLLKRPKRNVRNFKA